MTEHRFPGLINVRAIDAAPRVIQSAFVRTDEQSKQARVELSFYPNTSPAERLAAGASAIVSVLQYLGDEWGASLA